MWYILSLALVHSRKLRNDFLYVPGLVQCNCPIWQALIFHTEEAVLVMCIRQVPPLLAQIPHKPIKQGFVSVGRAAIIHMHI